MEAEGNSASQSGVEELPSTPDMSAQDAEAMVSSMLQDSTLPNSERANEEIPEDGGSSKLPEGGEGEKLPAGKLVVPCTKGILLFALSVIK